MSLPSRFVLTVYLPPETTLITLDLKLDLLDLCFRNSYDTMKRLKFIGCTMIRRGSSFVR